MTQDDARAASAGRCLAAFESARRALDVASEGAAILAADGVRTGGGACAWLPLRIAYGPVRIPDAFESDLMPPADAPSAPASRRRAMFGVHDGEFCLLRAAESDPSEAGSNEDEPVVLLRYADEAAFIRALLDRLERALR